MTLLMPSLIRAPNGDHFSRKAIPSDVREAYAAAHGVKREALFGSPQALPKPTQRRPTRSGSPRSRVVSLRFALRRVASQ
jgi:hypothetical protein